MRPGMDAARPPRSTRAPRLGAAPAPGSLRLTERVRASIRRDALEHVAARYELSEAEREALAAVPLRWRRGRGSSCFYPRPAHGFAVPHILVRVPTGALARWHTYRRARARFTTPPGGIELEVRVLATAVLVHELTHALQHGVAGGARRRYSEVETTENEIDYVRRAAPEAFARLVPVVRAPARPSRRAAAGSGRPDAGPASALHALRAIVLRFAGSFAGLMRPASTPRATAPRSSRRRSRSPRPTGS
jgi:hypothetical protein